MSHASVQLRCMLFNVGYSCILLSLCMGSFKEVVVYLETKVSKRTGKVAKSVLICIHLHTPQEICELSLFVDSPLW